MMKRFGWMLTGGLLAWVILNLAWAILPQVSAATQAYLGLAHIKYPHIIGSRIDRCVLCHVSESGGILRNAYGDAWQAAGKDYTSFAAIEALDSDLDGYSNLAEITALTYPGNRFDFPVFTPTFTPSPSATPSQTPTRTHTPTQTATPTASATPTHSPTVTTTPPPTYTPTLSPTPTHTSAPTETPTPTRTATPVSSPTPTATLPPYTGRLRGTIRLFGSSNHAGAIITMAGRYALTAPDGQFQVEGVPAGVWSAAVSHTGYLSALRPSVVILSGQDVRLPDLNLDSGDANGDCVIDLFDLVIVAAALDPSRPASDPRADLNADGVVSMLDLVMVSRYYGAICPQVW